MRKILPLILVILLCGCRAKNTISDNRVTDTPAKAIASLKDGNARFVAGESTNPNSCTLRVAHTAPHQEPFVAVVGCSDSRVPVELIFDHGIGDIFVIRTAGNTVNNAITMGSVDYAVAHLNVKAVIVLGHGSCGGIKGAISTDNHSDESKGSVAEMLELIRGDISEYIGNHDKVDEAVKANAQAQAERIKSTPYIANRIARGELVVCSAYYDVNTGKVEFVE